MNDEVVWGVNSVGKIYRKEGKEWKVIEGSLKMISVGESGVWGVNSNDHI